MGRVTLEQLLVAARPEEMVSDGIFVSSVMQKIERPVIKSAFVRSMNEQHNNKGVLFMNTVRALPAGVLAAIIIGGAALTGGVAYAVYKAVIEPLSVEQTSLITRDNKNETTFSIEGCPSYEGVSQGEITAITDSNSGISSDEARKYVIAACEINAITKVAHDMVRAKGVELYDSSVLATHLPFVMPGEDASSVETDMGPREITANTQFYKSGKRVSRSDIPAGSLIHVAYGGTPQKSSPDTFVIMQASVEMKYYELAYDVGPVLQRVPCRNNPSEGCLSTIPGLTFYNTIFDGTGPLPPEQQHYQDSMDKEGTVEIGGIITSIHGNAFTIRTSKNRKVTFYLPERVLEWERPAEHVLPKIGEEVIIRAIGSNRDIIESEKLLYGIRPGARTQYE